MVMSYGSNDHKFPGMDRIFLEEKIRRIREENQVSLSLSSPAAAGEEKWAKDTTRYELIWHYSLVAEHFLGLLSKRAECKWSKCHASGLVGREIQRSSSRLQHPYENSARNRVTANTDAFSLLKFYLKGLCMI